MKLQTQSPDEALSFSKPHIPEGTYEGILINVKDISPGKYGDRLAFIYRILVGDKDVEIAYVCYKVPATSENKLGQALIAHGKVLDGTEIDTESIINGKARVWVEDFEYEEERDGKKEVKTASTISKVKPIKDEVIQPKVEAQTTV